MNYTTQLSPKFVFISLLIFLALTINVSADSSDHEQIIQIDPDLASWKIKGPLMLQGGLGAAAYRDIRITPLEH